MLSLTISNDVDDVDDVDDREPDKEHQKTKSTKQHTHTQENPSANNSALP